MSVRKSLGYWVMFLILLFTVPASRPEINVAFTGAVSQSPDEQSRWGAEKAIDSCTTQSLASNCCSHTKSGTYKEAWWRVDLGQTNTIQYITIYYRGLAAYRFGGYSLYLSNTTSYTQGVLCYKDYSILVSDVQLNPTHLCPYVAQYVIVYNQRNTPKKYDWYDAYAVLELCEVQVFGCPTGKYGNGNCNSPCSQSCFGGNCDPVSGSCFYCFAGMYGDFCQVPCTANCYNACEKNSGHCIGCIAGKTGDLCDTDCPVNCITCNQTFATQCYECVNGMHGETCQLACSDDCKDETCMKDNGYCLECVDGKHGDMCGNDCSNNCENKLCKKDGHCLACIPGKKGNLCDSNCPSNCVTCHQTSDQCFECVIGKYGNSCENNCSENCKDKTCIKSNGHCVECISGKYDPTCSEDCLGLCKDNTCQRDNGYCTDCPQGKYGSLCEKSCSWNCLDNECDASSGFCKECKDGYFGPNCNSKCETDCKICRKSDGVCTACVDGLYGDSCTLSCGNCERCMKDTGHCLSTCTSGYEGNTCMSITTQANSLNIAAVGIGSGCGLVILALVIVIIMLVRRLSKGKTDTTPHVTDMSKVVRQQQTDGTYEEVGAMPTNLCVQMETINENYEKLDTQTMESTHIYQTTEQVLT